MKVESIARTRDWKTTEKKCSCEFSQRAVVGQARVVPEGWVLGMGIFSLILEGITISTMVAGVRRFTGFNIRDMVRSVGCSDGGFLVCGHGVLLPILTSVMPRWFTASATKS